MNKDIEKAKARIRNVLPTKKNALYDSHMYWSQKAYNICDILIEELSGTNDVIFDPFLGSGVTLLESVQKKYKRRAIGCELNEAPLFIVKTLLKDYNLEIYRKESEQLVTALDRLEKYYITKCPICGSSAKITSTLFDMESRLSKPTLKKSNLFCDSCKRVEKAASVDDENLMTTEYTIVNIEKMILRENSKLAVYQDETIDQIFTKRNFKVLDEIVGIINEIEQYQDVFRYILMSIIHLCKITDTHSNSQWPLWIPKTNCVEKNIIDIYKKRIKKFEETIIYLNENYDTEKNYTLLHKGSQYINENDIPSESVSLIITDPPYLGQVAYSEYMQIYKPFLGFDINFNDEIIVSTTPDRKISEAQYFKLLDDVFKMCDRIMIPGGYFCMYFHDCNLKVWDMLIKLMSKNHFKYLSQEHVKKGNTLKNIISPKKSLNGDAILFFVKEPFQYEPPASIEQIDEIEKNLIIQIKGMIKEKGPLSTPQLYDGGLIEYLVYNGWLEPISRKYKTLVDIFEKCLDWNPSTNTWE